MQLFQIESAEKKANTQFMQKLLNECVSVCFTSLNEKTIIWAVVVALNLCMKCKQSYFVLFQLIFIADVNGFGFIVRCQLFVWFVELMYVACVSINIYFFSFFVHYSIIISCVQITG